MEKRVPTRPYYETKSNYMIQYDYAVIKLNHLFESIHHIGLTQKLDALDYG